MTVRKQGANWFHDHVFDTGSPAAERGTHAVMWITAAMMAVEIVAGWWFNSMALLADGWHMSSHAVAIGLSAFAYAAARRYSRDPRFAFGTWKIEVLAGFASAVFLLCIAAMMVFGSVERIFAPQPIHYEQAIVVAGLGLAVNVVCALILGGAREGRSHHGHSHDHAQAHGHHPDLNLKSAYLHVVADAATSVLAIVALAGGWAYGWSWLDPVMGIVGATLVGVWATGLLKECGRALLDAEMDAPVAAEIRAAIAGLPVVAEIHDLHVWRVGKGSYACILSLASAGPLTPDDVRAYLAVHEEIVHVTAEVNVISNSG
jgi:cation diffusion facilitator family transporter